MDVNIISYSIQVLCTIFLVLGIYYREDNSIILEAVAHTLVGYLIYHTGMHVLWVAWAYYAYILWEKYRDYVALEKSKTVESIDRQAQENLDTLESELLKCRLNRLSCLAGIHENGKWGHSPCEDTWRPNEDRISEIEDEIFELTGYRDEAVDNVEAIFKSRQRDIRYIVIDKLRRLECHKLGKSYAEANSAVFGEENDGTDPEFREMTEGYLDEAQTVRDIYLDEVRIVMDKINRCHELSRQRYEPYKIIGKAYKNKDYQKNQRIYDESLEEVNILLYGDIANPPPQKQSHYNRVSPSSKYGATSGKLSRDELMDKFKAIAGNTYFNPDSDEEE